MILFPSCQAQISMFNIKRKLDQCRNRSWTEYAIHLFLNVDSIYWVTRTQRFNLFKSNAAIREFENLHAVFVDCISFSRTYSILEMRVYWALTVFCALFWPPKIFFKFFKKISSLLGLECCSRGVRGSHALHVPWKPNTHSSSTSVPMRESTSHSSRVRHAPRFRFTGPSEKPLCEYRVAPGMAMTVGMTMVLPSSHSLKQ